MGKLDNFSIFHDLKKEFHFMENVNGSWAVEHIIGYVFGDKRKDDGDDYCGSMPIRGLFVTIYGLGVRL